MNYPNGIKREENIPNKEKTINYKNRGMDWYKIFNDK